MNFRDSNSSASKRAFLISGCRRVLRLALAIPTLAVVAGSARASELTDAIARQMDGIARSGAPASAVSAAELEAAPAEALAALAAYAESPSANVRERANALSAATARAVGAPDQRMGATDQLARALGDKSALVAQGAARNLLGFEPADFSIGARLAIAERLDETPPAADIVRLAGLAPAPGVEVRLRALLSDERAHEAGTAFAGRWFTTPGWAARLALARLGSKADLERVIELIEDERDPVIRVTRLYADLAYTGTDAGLAVVAAALLSEGVLPPVEEGKKPTPFAQYALDFLARAAKDCPVAPKYPGGYSDAEIATAREWAKERFGGI